MRSAFEERSSFSKKRDGSFETLTKITTPAEGTTPVGLEFLLRRLQVAGQAPCGGRPSERGSGRRALPAVYQGRPAACSPSMTRGRVRHCRYYAERCTHGPWRLRSARGFSRRSVTMTTTTRTSESTAPSVGLLLAFELGQRSWKVGFTVG